MTSLLLIKKAIKDLLIKYLLRDSMENWIITAYNKWSDRPDVHVLRQLFKNELVKVKNQMVDSLVSRA